VRLASGGALHVSGPPAGQPVLLLHGVGGGAWSWAPQAEALEREARCYRWEGRGHGLAARVADAGLAEYFTDAREALAAVSAEGSAPLVGGHSMGGLLALALATEPDAPPVAGLFLIEPVYAPDGGRHAAGVLAGAARVLVSPLVRSLQRDGRVGRTLARSVFRAAFEDDDAMERAWLEQRTQVPVEYPKMMYEAFEGTTGFPNRAFALEVSQPVTLLEGSVARRRPRFPELNSTLSERLGQRFTYVRIDGGHYLQLDRPEPVNAALRDALRSVR
jgi:pimeloyl-ACP methyl ester carboxylesterase